MLPSKFRMLLVLSLTLLPWERGGLPTPCGLSSTLLLRDIVADQSLAPLVKVRETYTVTDGVILGNPTTGQASDRQADGPGKVDTLDLPRAYEPRCATGALKPKARSSKPRSRRTGSKLSTCAFLVSQRPQGRSQRVYFGRCHHGYARAGIRSPEIGGRTLQGSGRQLFGDRLPFDSIEFTDGGKAVRFNDRKVGQCDLTSYECTPAPKKSKAAALEECRGDFLRLTRIAGAKTRRRLRNFPQRNCRKKRNSARRKGSRRMKHGSTVGWLLSRITTFSSPPGRQRNAGDEERHREQFRCSAVVGICRTAKL